MRLTLNIEIHAYTDFLPVTISAECDPRLHASGNKISFYTFTAHINYWWQVSDILQMEHTHLQNRK